MVEGSECIFNISEYLLPWIDKVVVINKLGDRWKEEKDRFLYHGTILPENRLREVLPNEVCIEFDFKVSEKDGITEGQFMSYRAEAVAACEKIRDFLLERHIRFHMTDHNGKSPHIHFIIKGLENYPHEIRKEYKTRMVQAALQATGFMSSTIEVDESLLKTFPKLVSIEYAPHFKSGEEGFYRFYGTEEIIHYNGFDSDTMVNEENIQELIQKRGESASEGWQKVNNCEYDSFDPFWGELIHLCLNHQIPEGSERNQVLLRNVGYLLKDYNDAYAMELAKGIIKNCPGETLAALWSYRSEPNRIPNKPEMLKWWDKYA
jgi:hypothetical protein